MHGKVRSQVSLVNPPGIEEEFQFDVMEHTLKLSPISIGFASSLITSGLLDCRPRLGEVLMSDRLAAFGGLILHGYEYRAVLSAARLLVI